MTNLPTRNPTEIVKAIEAAVVVAQAKGQPCDAVLVREWEFLIAVFEHPDLSRQHWKRSVRGFEFKGVPIIPAMQEHVESQAPEGGWIAVARKAPDPGACESD